jgi:hypothetical protein
VAARSAIKVAQGVVATAGVTCPEGTTPAVDTSGPVAKFLGCKVPTTHRTETSLTEGFGSFLVQGVSNFISPGSGVKNITEQGVRQELMNAPMVDNTYYAPTSLKPIYIQEAPMSFADGDSSGFSLPTLSDINSILQGPIGQNLLNFGTQYALQSLAPSTPNYGLQPASMAAVPAVMGAGRAVATVGRSFFNRFPNLATAIQGLRNQGRNVTRSNLYSLMKRFGPDFLITGGILTAAAVSELAMAGPGRRRMNPGNVKALRRAHRRMKSFHHVCQVNDTLLTHRRRPARRGSFAGTSITQVK